jgi:hypothetical protein
MLVLVFSARNTRDDDDEDVDDTKAAGARCSLLNDSDGPKADVVVVNRPCNNNKSVIKSLIVPGALGLLEL